MGVTSGYVIEVTLLLFQRLAPYQKSGEKKWKNSHEKCESRNDKLELSMQFHLMLIFSQILTDVAVNTWL